MALWHISGRRPAGLAATSSCRTCFHLRYALYIVHVNLYSYSYSGIPILYRAQFIVYCVLQFTSYRVQYYRTVNTLVPLIPTAHIRSVLYSASTRVCVVVGGGALAVGCCSQVLVVGAAFSSRSRRVHVAAIAAGLSRSSIERRVAAPTIDSLDDLVTCFTRLIGYRDLVHQFMWRCILTRCILTKPLVPPLPTAPRAYDYCFFFL